MLVESGQLLRYLYLGDEKTIAFNINISSSRTDLRLLKARLETGQSRVPEEAYVAKEKHAQGKGACFKRS